MTEAAALSAAELRKAIAFNHAKNWLHGQFGSHTSRNIWEMLAPEDIESLASEFNRLLAMIEAGQREISHIKDRLSVKDKALEEVRAERDAAQQAAAEAREAADMDFVQRAVYTFAAEFEVVAKNAVHAVAATAREHANARQSLMDQRDELQNDNVNLKVQLAEAQRRLEVVTRLAHAACDESVRAKRQFTAMAHAPLEALGKALSTPAAKGAEETQPLDGERVGLAEQTRVDMEASQASETPYPRERTGSMNGNGGPWYCPPGKYFGQMCPEEGCAKADGCFRERQAHPPASTPSGGEGCDSQKNVLRLLRRSPKF